MQDKPALKSVTVWGGIAIGLSQMLDPIGQWMTGALTLEEMLAKVVVGLGIVLTIVGVRRKLGAAG